MTSVNVQSNHENPEFYISKRISSAGTYRSPKVQEYWTKGFVLLRGMFDSQEIDQWSNECDRLLKKPWVKKNNVRTPFNRNSGIYPERIDPIVDISSVFQNLATDKRILNVVEDIFQDSALLFKDKLIFKAPGAHGYTIHQDQAWWQLCSADDILSVSIQIDGANKDNGCIELFPEKHDRMRTPVGVNTNYKDQDLLDEYANYEKEAMETIPGDVLIFHSLAPHCSGINVSQTFRRSLYLTYNAAHCGNFYTEQLEHYVARLKKDPQYDVFV